LRQVQIGHQACLSMLTTSLASDTEEADVVN
jgi:hypothetical protein